MKSLKLATLVAFGLSTPFTAISSNDNSIHNRALQLHETSQDSMMTSVQLPQTEFSGRLLLAKKNGSGSGKQFKKKFQQSTKEQLKQGQGDGEMDRDRDRTRDQDQSMTQEQEQNRVRHRIQER